MISQFLSDNLLQRYGAVAGILDDLTVIILVVVVTFVLKFIFSKLIDNLFSDKSHSLKSRIDPSRRATLKSMTKNAGKYLLYFIALMVILGQFINISSILTIAGIGGIIISLGLKSMIEDIVAGFFIVFEDQYNVGDFITVDKYNGVVESIGIRTTTIADFNGDMHSIHNGTISVITNHSRKDQRVMFDIGIDYDALLRVLQRLNVPKILYLIFHNLWYDLVNRSYGIDCETVLNTQCKLLEFFGRLKISRAVTDLARESAGIYPSCPKRQIGIEMLLMPKRV